ncbi:MAG: hypothetical protein P4K93_00385 [Terracidiphilus sp.]|nr:hypothetical protein [Terracidiphilus sp.]MDR3796575.1 hypothetical protein [Terracidiphilus sp.]
MPGSRWNRRETNVAQAGYFTVLRSAGWFSTLTHLPGGYRYVVKGPATPELLVKPEGAGAAAQENHDSAQRTAPAFETLAPKASGLRLLRLALIALVAVGLTALFFLLLHLDSPGG